MTEDDPELSDLLALVERISEQLDRLTHAVETVAAKLDKANETLANLNRSQWG